MFLSFFDVVALVCFDTLLYRFIYIYYFNKTKINKHSNKYDEIKIQKSHIMSFLPDGDICCLLIAFANSLYPVKDLQNVGLDLESLCMSLSGS